MIKYVKETLGANAVYSMNLSWSHHHRNDTQIKMMITNNADSTMSFGAGTVKRSHPYIAALSNQTF